jgi:hypothetical protein
LRDFRLRRRIVSRTGLVALVRTGVGEGLARDGDEAPVVAIRMEGELYDAVGVGVANLAVGLDGAEGFVARASRAHDKLPYPRDESATPSGACGANLS